MKKLLVLLSCHGCICLLFPFLLSSFFFWFRHALESYSKMTPHNDRYRCLISEKNHIVWMYATDSWPTEPSYIPATTIIILFNIFMITLLPWFLGFHLSFNYSMFRKYVEREFNARGQFLDDEEWAEYRY